MLWLMVDFEDSDHHENSMNNYAAKPKKNHGESWMKTALQKLWAYPLKKMGHALQSSFKNSIFD